MWHFFEGSSKKKPGCLHRRCLVQDERGFFWLVRFFLPVGGYSCCRGRSFAAQLRQIKQRYFLHAESRKKGADQTHPALFKRGFQPELFIGGTEVPHGLMAFLKGKKPAGLFRREGRSIRSSLCVCGCYLFLFLLLKKGISCAEPCHHTVCAVNKAFKDVCCSLATALRFFPGITH